jgi:CTP-dependent riboflavin kinase
VLTGTVVSGEGWHQKNMGHWKVLPFKAFPGTLNIEVGAEAVARLLERDGNVTVGKGVDFLWWPARFRGLDVAVTWNVGCAPGVVELVASQRLRDLPLTNGDVVEVEL